MKMTNQEFKDYLTRIRKLVMIEAHLLALVPLAAVFMARGYGSF